MFKDHSNVTSSIRTTLSSKTMRGREASHISSNAGQCYQSHWTIYTEWWGCGGAGQWGPSIYTSSLPGHTSKAINKVCSRGLYTFLPPGHTSKAINKAYSRGLYTSLLPEHMSKAINKAYSRGLYNSAEYKVSEKCMRPWDKAVFYMQFRYTSQIE